MAQMQHEEKKRENNSIKKKSEPYDEDVVLSVLKLDDKGWNPDLVENQAALNEHGRLCAACGAICDNPAELACHVEHKDNEILAYCLSCLQQLIADNDQKCPINAHEKPVTLRNRLNRVQIANLIVFCPYSTYFRARQQQIDEDDIAAAANRGVQDTLGAHYEEKEGGGGAPQRRQEPGPAAAARAEHVQLQTECAWKGKLSELINSHIAECIKQNDPSFVYKSQIKALKKRVSKLESELNEKQKEVDFLKAEQKQTMTENKRQITDLSELTEMQATHISELLELNKQLEGRLASKQREEEEEKMHAVNFTFNKLKCSGYIELKNGKTIRNRVFDLPSHSDGGYHSVVFGPVIECAQYKQYRIRFRINKISDYGFMIGFASTMLDIKNVEKGGPGRGDNKQTTTGIYVTKNNKFYLSDKDHKYHKMNILSSDLWEGWYPNQEGFAFLMEFDFVGNVFSLHWVSDSSTMSKKSDHKIFQIENIPKHTILPIFALIAEGDEIEIVECVLN